MGQDIAIREKAPLVAGGRIAPIVPTTYEDAYRIAVGIAKSGLAPLDMNTPEKALVAVMTGMELGLPPMAAVNSVAVINGRPSLWGDAVPGICREYLEWVKETYEGTPFEEAYTAICELKRKGDPTIYRNEFSVADAKVAKLWGKTSKSGNPTPWVTSPKRMLKMRARSFTYRDAFPDVLKGIITTEEMMDVNDEDRRLAIEHEAPDPGPVETAPEPSPEPTAAAPVGGGEDATSAVWPDPEVALTPDPAPPELEPFDTAGFLEFLDQQLAKQVSDSALMDVIDKVTETLDVPHTAYIAMQEVYDRHRARVEKAAAEADEPPPPDDEPPPPDDEPEAAQPLSDPALAGMVRDAYRAGFVSKKADMPKVWAKTPLQVQSSWHAGHEDAQAGKPSRYP